MITTQNKRTTIDKYKINIKLFFKKIIKLK